MANVRLAAAFDLCTEACVYCIGKRRNFTTLLPSYVSDTE